MKTQQMGRIANFSLTDPGKKSRGGFTLIELLVVIAILGILSAVAIPQYLGYRERSKARGLETQCNQVYKLVFGCIKQDDGIAGTSELDLLLMDGIPDTSAGGAVCTAIVAGSYLQIQLTGTLTNLARSAYQVGTPGCSAASATNVLAAAAANCQCSVVLGPAAVVITALNTKGETTFAANVSLD